MWDTWLTALSAKGTKWDEQSLDGDGLSVPLVLAEYVVAYFKSIQESGKSKDRFRPSESLLAMAGYGQ